MSSRKIIDRAPILAPELKATPLAQKLMYNLNQKNEKKYSRVIDINCKSPDKTKITLSSAQSFRPRNDEGNVGIGGSQRSKRKMVPEEFSVGDKIERIKESVIGVDDSRRIILPNAMRSKPNVTEFTYKKQKRNPTEKTEATLSNQFEKTLHLGEKLPKTRIYRRKLRVIEPPGTYIRNEHVYDEIKRIKLSIETKSDLASRYLTNEKYNNVKTWCDTQPFDEAKEIAFEEIDVGDNPELSSSSEELDDFSRLIAKKPRIRILDIKYLKENEKLKIQTDILRKDPVTYLDKYAAKIASRISLDEPKREIQTKILSILKCNEENKQSTGIKKKYKQTKITDVFKKR